MEQMFGTGIRDARGALRYRRPADTVRRLRGAVIALALAVTAVLILAGVVYGGATSGAETIVVHQGQTLWGIATAHYPGDDVQDRVAQIEAANHLAGAQLSPGQVLTLPAP